MKIRVLFVCMGNICRSPAAECVFRKLVAEAGLTGDVECDSAGTISHHAGAPPDGRMREELARRGIPVLGRARAVRPEDLDGHDLVLAMDRDNLAHLHRLAKGKKPTDHIRLFCEFCRKSDAEEVPDPYYGGRSGFRTVVDLIEDGCAGLMEETRKRLES